MHRPTTKLIATIVLCSSSFLSVHPAETGDFDGDGRLSIGDVLHHIDGRPPAPGSIDGFARRQCFTWNLFQRFTMPGAVYLESLRRQVDGAPPDWLGIWPTRTRAEPLPPDGRVVAVLLDAVARGGASDRVRLELRLSSFVPIVAFSLLLEGSVPELLRPLYAPGGLWEGYRNWSEISVNYQDEFEHDGGDYPVWVTTPAYLASGGRLALNYNLTGRRRAGTIPPGDARFVFEARLPGGTRAGRYDLRILPGSEVLLDDGTLVSPETHRTTALTSIPAESSERSQSSGCA